MSPGRSRRSNLSNSVVSMISTWEAMRRRIKQCQVMGRKELEEEQTKCQEHHMAMMAGQSQSTKQSISEMCGDSIDDGPNNDGWEDIEMADSTPTLGEADIFVCAIHDILPEWCVVNSFHLPNTHYICCLGDTDLRVDTHGKNNDKTCMMTGQGQCPQLLLCISNGIMIGLAFQMPALVTSSQLLSLTYTH